MHAFLNNLAKCKNDGVITLTAKYKELAQSQMCRCKPKSCAFSQKYMVKILSFKCYALSKYKQKTKICKQRLVIRPNLNDY